MPMDSIEFQQIVRGCNRPDSTADEETMVPHG